MACCDSGGDGRVGRRRTGWCSVKCPSCQQDNREGAAFCDQCGAVLAPKCPNCSAQLRPGARFCDACGVSVSEPQSVEAKPADSDLREVTPSHLVSKILKERGRIAGERRNVTVLFADAKGFTPMSEKLDAEQVYDYIQGSYEHMLDAVHRHEGTVNQFTGDGIMALFGAPIAHEDSARRAVAAALDMQRALTAYAAESGAPLAFRIGVNTGPVVVGDIGDDLKMDYTAIGDTTNLAARMEQMAQPDSVYLTETTYRAVAEYFDFEDLGLLDVKGKSDKVHVYKAVAERDVRTRMDAAVARGLSPFCGRNREVETLKGMWQQALGGRGQIVLISGEPGIGKSRLLLEFRRALGDDVIWREAHCVSSGENIPYLPVIELVKSGFGIADGDDEGTIITKVDVDTAQWSPQAQKTAPYLKFLLQVDPGDAAIELMDPMQRRAGILDALRALVIERSKIAPRVVVVEDLHWADTQSEEVIRAIADVVAASPVLMILTFRPGYLHPSMDLPHAHRIVLCDLDSAARSQLAEATLEAAELPDSLVEGVTEKAEGNPLFIEEVAKAIAAGATDIGAVPNSLQDVILARIDRLDIGARESLQLASVIGREFTLRLLDRISNLQSELTSVLTELKGLELIYEKSFFPELAYMFKHALTHDVAYSTLLVERRKILHRTVAAAIEEVYPDRLAEHYETLAQHYELAEDWPKALHYLTLSGEKAASSYAGSDAALFYGRAFKICIDLGDHVRAADIAHRRGQANLSIFAVLDAVADFDRMLEASRATQDEHLESLALAARSVAEFFAHEFAVSERSAREALKVGLDRFDDTKFTANIGLAATYFVTDRLEDGEKHYEESVRFIDSAQEPILVWLCGEFDVLRSNWTGSYDAAVLEFERWMARLRPQGSVATVPVAWAGGVALGGRGDYERGLEVLNQVVEVCEQTDAFPDFRARALNTIGWLFGEIEDHEASLKWNERGLAAALEIESADPEFKNNAILNLGDSLCALGDLGAAEKRYDEVERIVRSPTPPDEWMMWRYSQHLFHSRGVLALSRGELAKAGAYAQECIEGAERSNSRKNLVKGLRLQGRVLMAAGDLPAAASSLGRALATAREIGNPPQLWKTLTDIADLRRLQKNDYASSYREAFAVAESVADGLADGRLRDSFLSSEEISRIREAAARS